MIHQIPCAYGPTIRAFVVAFGNEVIGQGHTVNMLVLVGRRVRVFKDELGWTLHAFDLV